jgi:hypothetical protein
VQREQADRPCGTSGRLADTLPEGIASRLGTAGSRMIDIDADESLGR